MDSIVLLIVIAFVIKHNRVRFSHKFQSRRMMEFQSHR
jgi:hypothetical protein